jgi:hypothetical protein
VKTVKAYKVVKVKNGKRWSAVVENATVLYATSKWVRQEKGNGPLACFRTLKDAILFANGLLQQGYVLEIWQAQIQQSSQPALWYWYNGMLQEVPQSDCPAGTVFANAVKLIKRVRVLSLQPKNDGT